MGCQFFDGVNSSYFVSFVIRAFYGLRIPGYFPTSEVLRAIFAIAKRPFVSFTVFRNFCLSLIKWPLLERIFVRFLRLLRFEAVHHTWVSRWVCENRTIPSLYMCVPLRFLRAAFENEQIKIYFKK